MHKATSKKPTRASWGSVHGVVIKNSLIRDEEGAPHRGSYEPPTLNCVVIAGAKSFDFGPEAT